MTKAEVVERIRQVIAVEPRRENKYGIVDFELNGVFLISVSGDTDYVSINFNDGGCGAENFDFERLTESLKEKLALARKAGTFTVPEAAVSLTGFDYYPGRKSDSGHFSLEADTPLGLLVWKEVIPGPWDGEDSHELQVTLNGKEVDLYKHDLHHDFEPPNKQGKWAEKFAASRDELEKELNDWFDSHRLVLAALAN